MLLSAWFARSDKADGTRYRLCGGVARDDLHRRVFAINEVDRLVEFSVADRFVLPVGSFDGDCSGDAVFNQP